MNERPSSIGHKYARPSAMSPYLHAFLLNEMKLRPADQIVEWQTRLSKLFRYMLRHGMPI
jgi:hypothetical protein